MSLSKLPSSPRAVLFFWVPLGASPLRAQIPSRRPTDCRCIYLSRCLAAWRPQKITLHDCRAPDCTVFSVFLCVALSTSPPSAQTTSRTLAMCLFISPHRCVPTNYRSEWLGVCVSMRLFQVWRTVSAVMPIVVRHCGAQCLAKFDATVAQLCILFLAHLQCTTASSQNFKFPQIFLNHCQFLKKTTFYLCTVI